MEARRVDAMGTREPSITRQGLNRIVVEAPGESDPEKLKAVIGQTAKLTFQMVDDEVSPEEGKAMARICALNALAAVNALVGVDAVKQVVKVVGFVASAPGFNGQPGVVNGASELLAEVFGDKGVHARSAVGVSELPLDAPVEVEMIVEVS